MPKITPDGRTHFGFDPSKIKIEAEHWKLGSNLPLTVLKQDGQWDDFLPVYEPQAEYYETDGCTVWGSQNQLETLFKFIFATEPNYSERFNYIMANVAPPGADPQVVYETIRNYGVINEELLNVPPTYAEFITPKPMTANFLDTGKAWLNKYAYFHEWIVPANPAKMKELIAQTLKYSPVGLSVTAWFRNASTGLYEDKGLPNCHWCLCYGYRVQQDGGIVLKIFDSYDQSKKELSPDHTISFAKRISLVQKIGELPTDIAKVTFIQWLFGLLGIKI